MESPSAGSGRRTLICSVVFVDIVDYSKKTVAKQLAIKSWFNELLGQALASTASDDRLILDTGDGAAICFPGDPEEALFTANGLRVSLAERNYPELAFRIGINLGPVKVVKDINGRPNIIGDGINVAQRVMSFADPNQILVSRSYYEVVSCLSEEYLRLFHYQGVRQDKHVRSHEVYEVYISAPGTHESAAATFEIDRTIPLQSAAQAEVSAPPMEFEASYLASLAGELAKQMGPIATVIVQRAARRSATREELLRSLSDAIPLPERRAEFLSAAGVGAAPPPGPAAVATTDPASTGAQSAGGVNEALATKAEHLLAVHIGPMARILVKKAARTSRGRKEFIEALADTIEDDDDRAAFIAAAEKSL